MPQGSSAVRPTNVFYLLVLLFLLHIFYVGCYFSGSYLFLPLSYIIQFDFVTVQFIPLICRIHFSTKRNIIPVTTEP